MASKAYIQHQVIKTFNAYVAARRKYGPNAKITKQLKAEADKADAAREEAHAKYHQHVATYYGY